MTWYFFVLQKMSIKCRKQGMQFYTANKLPSQTSLTTIVTLGKKLHICTAEETVNLLLRNFGVCTHIHQPSGSRTCCYSTSHLYTERNALLQALTYKEKHGGSFVFIYFYSQCYFCASYAHFTNSQNPRYNCSQLLSEWWWSWWWWWWTIVRTFIPVYSPSRTASVV
jgi:hypothetical protein